jgi:hypothetical protein
VKKPVRGEDGPFPDDTTSLSWLEDCAIETETGIKVLYSNNRQIRLR